MILRWTILGTGLFDELGKKRLKESYMREDESFSTRKIRICIELVWFQSGTCPAPLRLR
jgi:hypothetical protein